MNVCVYSPGEVPPGDLSTRQELPMTNRATSAYQLTVTTPDGDQQHFLDTLRDAALAYVEVLTDTHVTAGGVCVGYRASDDQAAVDIAVQTLRAYGDPNPRWSLHTGYGVHKRVIQGTAGTLSDEGHSPHHSAAR